MNSDFVLIFQDSFFALGRRFYSSSSSNKFLEVSRGFSLSSEGTLSEVLFTIELSSSLLMMGSSPDLPANFSSSGFYFSELVLQSHIVESLVILGEGAIVYGDLGG